MDRFKEFLRIISFDYLHHLFVKLSLFFSFHQNLSNLVDAKKYFKSMISYFYYYFFHATILLAMLEIMLELFTLQYLDY